MDPYLLDMQWSLKKSMIRSRWLCKCSSSVVHIFFWKLNHLTTKIWSMSCWQFTTYWDAIWASSCIIWNLILTNFQITWVSARWAFSPGPKWWSIIIRDGGPRTWVFLEPKMRLLQLTTWGKITETRISKFLIVNHGLTTQNDFLFLLCLNTIQFWFGNL